MIYWMCSGPCGGHAGHRRTLSLARLDARRSRRVGTLIKYDSLHNFRCYHLDFACMHTVVMVITVAIVRGIVVALVIVIATACAGIALFGYIL